MHLVLWKREALAAAAVAAAAAAARSLRSPCADPVLSVNGAMATVRVMAAARSAGAATVTASLTLSQAVAAAIEGVADTALGVGMVGKGKNEAQRGSGASVRWHAPACASCSEYSLAHFLPHTNINIVPSQLCLSQQQHCSLFLSFLPTSWPGGRLRMAAP